MEKKFYSIRQVCGDFEVSYAAVYRWIQSGQLRCIKLPGGQLRIPAEEIERILSQEREALPA